MAEIWYVNILFIRVIDFINWLLTDEESARKYIGEILAGKSGIITDGQDVFAPTYSERNFSLLREIGITADQAYTGILREIFHLSLGQGRSIQLFDLKHAEGEIALATGTSPEFFGVINVGDKPGLLKLIGERLPELQRRNDELSPSQFNNINEKVSSVNILIGAKNSLKAGILGVLPICVS